jgi:hypothetical protein
MTLVPYIHNRKAIEKILRELTNDNQVYDGHVCSSFEAAAKILESQYGYSNYEWLEIAAFLRKVLDEVTWGDD